MKYILQKERIAITGDTSGHPSAYQAQYGQWNCVTDCVVLDVIGYTKASVVGTVSGALLISLLAWNVDFFYKPFYNPLPTDKLLAYGGPNSAANLRDHLNLVDIDATAFLTPSGTYDIFTNKLNPDYQFLEVLYLIPVKK